MKNIVKWIWIACGVVLLISITLTAIHANLVIRDIRNVTSQMTIDDIRKVLDLYEKSLDLKLSQNSYQPDGFPPNEWQINGMINSLGESK